MGLLYTGASDVVAKEKYAICVSAIGTGTKIGSLFGASLFGIIAATTLGYAGAYIFFAFVSILALLCMVTLKDLK